MEEKVYVFIASSKEQLDFAELVQEKLESVAYPTVWDQGIFQPSKPPLDSLLKELRRCDIGIFIFTPDDILKMREEEFKAVRDNVIFELGLFIGQLGPDRCFMIKPKGEAIRIPSDLVGFTPIEYDETHPELEAAINPAIRKIKRAIKQLGKKEPKSVILEGKIINISCNNEAKFSTGAAIKCISSEVIKAIKNGDILGLDDYINFSKKLGRSIRKEMVDFCHFMKIGEEYPLSHWPYDIKYLSNYTQIYLDYIERCTKEIGKSFGQFLIDKSNICLTEYSRAILSGIIYRLKIGKKLNVYLVDRGLKANVPDEVSEIEKILVKNGVHILRKMDLEEWIQFLEEIIRRNVENIDCIVFGAEALTHKGDNVFPQIITKREQELLSKIRKLSERNIKIVCVAENYKVLSEKVYDYLLSLPQKGNYSIIPHEIFDLIITNNRQIEVSKKSEELINCVEESIESSRQICLNILKDERFLPFEYFPNSYLRNIKVIAADIDDTLTINGKIYPEILEAFIKLQEFQISVVLITGRSTGWCQALINYFPNIDLIIAENGSVLVDRNGKYFFLDDEIFDNIEETIKTMADLLKNKYGLPYSFDNCFRLRDQALVKPKEFTHLKIQELNKSMPESIEIVASSLHIHVRKKGSDKGKALEKIIRDKFHITKDQVLVVGDSPTDKSLFKLFKNSVGVANILNYMDDLGEITPKYITRPSEGKGFLEIIERLIYALKNT